MEEEACVWRSEDSLLSLLSPDKWLLGIELKSSHTLRPIKRMHINGSRERKFTQCGHVGKMNKEVHRPTAQVHLQVLGIDLL